MPRNRDEQPAVRVYTVCDESKYLIVRNVPALGCGDELLKLFGSYGEVEECKPMDAEDCEEFTDVYWIKFRQVNNARFAKRKLDKSVFLGNCIQVSYATHYESLDDTKEKLEGRRREVLARINLSAARSKGPIVRSAGFSNEPSAVAASSQTRFTSHSLNSQESQQKWGSGELPQSIRSQDSSSIVTVSSNQDYFPLESMNQTVRFVREKLNKIQSDAKTLQAGPSKKKRVDNRRRI